MSENDSERPTMSNMVHKVIQTKIDVNRRYVDEILEKMQEQNRQYFLDRYNDELAAMDRENEIGNSKRALRHQIMAETYKSIAERCFAQGG